MKNQSQVNDADWTILKLIKWTELYFTKYNIDTPRADAELLLASTLNLSKVDLYLQYDKPLSSNELSKFKSFVKRRVAREPVAYIIGKKGFWNLELSVSDNVLIPRPETEHLVEEALKFIPKNSHKRYILDLGTGSGAIILALANERPDNLFFASDISFNAIKQAKYNSQVHGLESKINFFLGAWTAPLKKNHIFFDLIVSNPPYIPTSDIPSLQREVALYEPILALDGNKNGIDCLKQIIDSAYIFLKPGGYLILEMGYNQKKDLQAIGSQTGQYENIYFIKDYAGHDRIACMQKKRLPINL